MSYCWFENMIDCGGQPVWLLIMALLSGTLFGSTAIQAERRLVIATMVAEIMYGFIMCLQFESRLYPMIVPSRSVFAILSCFFAIFMFYDSCAPVQFT